MKKLHLFFSIIFCVNAESPSWVKDEGLRFEEEKQANSSGMFGSNPHYSYHPYYSDLSRRFVPQYKYADSDSSGEIRKNIGPLIPLRASPELVLAVAAESAKLEALKPKEIINDKNMLRSGKYWDSFWKEDFNPDSIARTVKKNKQPVNVISNTELEKLIQTLRKMSPKLIYVINN